MLISGLVSILVVSLCICIHFYALRRLAIVLNRSHPPVRKPLLLLFFVLYLVHLLEVMLYAVAMSLLDLAGLGKLDGAMTTTSGWFFDHFYFSIAAYTTLGIGDIVPHGQMRILAGMEALNGLVLITWSASFSYLMMERFWGHDDDPNQKID